MVSPATFLSPSTSHRRRARRRLVTFDEAHRRCSDRADAGYAGGLIAAALGSPNVEVRFARPIPLERELELAPMPGPRLELRSASGVHAVGVPADLAIDMPAPRDEGTVDVIWTPQHDQVDEHGQARGEEVWAALERSQLRALPDGTAPVVLTTRIDRPVVACEPHVVTGWPIAREGRMLLAGAAVIEPGGAVCAISLQTALAG